MFEWFANGLQQVNTSEHWCCFGLQFSFLLSPIMFCPHKETTFGIKHWAKSPNISSRPNSGTSSGFIDLGKKCRCWVAPPNQTNSRVKSSKVVIGGIPSAAPLILRMFSIWGKDLVFIPKYQSTENRSHFLHIFMLCKQMETTSSALLSFPYLNRRARSSSLQNLQFSAG